MQTLIAVTFVFGIYSMTTNDKYSNSNVFIGLIFFPYAFIVAGQEIAFRLSVPSNIRETEKECQSKLKEYKYEREKRYVICQDMRNLLLKTPLSKDKQNEIIEYFTKETETKNQHKKS